jgi:type II secretory pathway component GspD/PulD (secretin)
LQLVTGGGATAGTTVITMGSDAYGVWGLIKMLVTQTKAKIISNPFVVATNKYPTEISIGENRRIASTTITNANNEQMSYTSDSADLSIKIVPTIQGEFVSVTVDLSNSIFTGPENNAVQSGNKTTRNLNTSVIVPDKSMVAIGGLIIDHNTEKENRVPWLADLPVVGWLFKSKEILNRKSMLLIFIEPVILKDQDFKTLEENVCQKMTALTQDRKVSYKCPIEKIFFKQDSLMKMSGYFSKGELGLNSFCPFKSKGLCQVNNLLEKKPLVLPNLSGIEEQPVCESSISSIKKKGIFGRHKKY